MEVNLRGQEQEKPQKTLAAPVAWGVAPLQKDEQRGSFSSGETERFFPFESCLCAPLTTKYKVPLS